MRDFFHIFINFVISCAPYCTKGPYTYDLSLVKYAFRKMEMEARSENQISQFLVLFF
jgi:hypothetical protein